MYAIQEAWFPFESFIKNIDQDDRIFMLLSSIDVQPIIEAFPVKQLGRRPYPRPAIFRALVLQKVLQLGSVEALVACLKYSPQLLHWCGFNYLRDKPSSTVFHKFVGELKERLGLQIVDEIAMGMMERLAPSAISHSMVILDSSDIPAKEAPPKKKKNSDDKKSKPDNQVEEGSCSNDITSPDITTTENKDSCRGDRNSGNEDEMEKISPLGSAWGHRTASEEETEIYYGYKYHAANVLTDLGVLPLAGIVAPANVSDQEMAEWLMREACRRHEALFGFRPAYYLEDAGYDALRFYNIARELKGQAIINLNKRNQKAPPDGFNEKGTPLCAAGHAMVYWGADRKQDTIKFRCPKAAGKKVDCQHQCNCYGSYGPVVRLHMADNPRLYTCPARESDKWQKIYNNRSSIERWYSVLKEHLGFAHMTRRGIHKASVDAMLSVIAFLAGTMAQVRMRNRLQQAA